MMLSSERIRARFGSYSIDVLECDERSRVSSLYSLFAGEKTCRTVAKVWFGIPVHPAVAAEHARVEAGESIGAVFQSAGWRIARRHLQVSETVLSPAEREIMEVMRLPPGTRLAIHAYVFHVAKTGCGIDYAHITERHHPAYLTAADFAVPASPHLK
jgi:hypothetical protein